MNDTQTDSIRLSDINAEGRVRRGDDATQAQTGTVRLAASISLQGLRRPVIIGPDNTLLSGYRRILAARRLGWGIIGYRRVQTIEEAAAAMAAELSDPEATPLTPYDMWVIGRRLEALPKVTPSGRRGGKDRRDLAADALGISSTTYNRVRAIYNAAAQDDPRAREAVQRLEAGGPIGGTYDWWRLPASRPAMPDDPASLDELGEPPAPNERTKEATQRRRQFIRVMAASGATSEQIGARLSIGAGIVRRIAKAEGIELKADAITSRARKNQVDSNAVLARAVEDLDAIKWSLSQVDVSQLDDDQADAWAKELSSFGHAAVRLAKAIRIRKEG